MKRGSLFVDAALTFPVFILAICALIGLIVQAGAEERTVCRLKEISIAAIDVSGVKEYYLTESECVDGDRLYADNVIRFGQGGKGFYKNIAFRPFVGESKQPEGEDWIVFVFPKAGERYHVEGCPILNRENYIQVLRSEAAEDGYTPCRICGGGEWEHKENDE